MILRLTDFWARLEEAFGPGYAGSIEFSPVISEAQLAEGAYFMFF